MKQSTQDQELFSHLINGEINDADRQKIRDLCLAKYIQKMQDFCEKEDGENEDEEEI